MRKLIILLVAISCVAASPTQRPTTVPAGGLEQTLYWLADDAREGRAVGSQGLNDAANYISNRFQNLRLRTLNGWDGYSQPFNMKLAENGKTLTIHSQNVGAVLPGDKRQD